MTLRIASFILVFLSLVMPLDLQSSIALANNELPDLGNPSASYVSSAEEKRYGDQFLRSLYKQFQVIDDPLLDNYIHDLGFRLVGSTNQSKGLHFQFLVINTPVVNAMAGPNGIIAIGSGLILATQTVSELAGVMAHEIAHVTQHHFAQGYAYSKKMTPAMIGLMVASLALATQNPNAGGGALAAGVAGTSSETLKIQRGHEQAADRIGFQILTQAGFDPNGMASFFLRLQKATRYYGNVPGFLTDHPLTSDRIADLTNRISEHPHPALKPDLRYLLMKERTRVITAELIPEILHHYDITLKKQPKGLHKTALDYGYALALASNHQFIEAEKRLKTLLTSAPNNTVYLVSLGQVYIDENQPEQAVSLLKSALDDNPDYYPMVVSYTNALLHAKSYQRGIHYLRQAMINFPDRPLLYVLLANLYAKNQELSKAYQSRAKAMLMVGNTQGALSQLHIALRQTDLTPTDRLKIQAQIKSLTPSNNKK